MKNKIKVLLCMALVVIMALATVACQKTEKESTSTDKKVITVGVDDSYPPMEYHDDKGDLVGFDIDLANALSEKMGGVEIQFISTAWDGIFLGLKADKYDAIISSVSMTPARMEEFEFTRPYLANGQVIVVKPGDTSIKSSDDLEGKIVGLQVETTADAAVKKQLEKTKFEVKKYDEIMQAFTDMSAGRVDCIVVDYAVAIEYQTKHPDKYEITTAQLTNEPIAICIKKGNTELRDKFDKAIDEVKKDGTLAEISKKWFNKDYTANIDTELYGVE